MKDEIELVTALLSFATAAATFAPILVSAKEHGLPLRQAFRSATARASTVATLLAILTFVCILGYYKYLKIHRQHLDQHIDEDEKWLNANMPLMGVISYQNDPVMGDGFEQLSHFGVTKCLMVLKRSFTPYDTPTPPPKTLAKYRTIYTEEFSMMLSHSSQPTKGTTYNKPDIRLQPETGNVIWETSYIDAKTGKLFRQIGGNSPTYRVRIHFPTKATADQAYTYLSDVVQNCHKSDH